LVADKPMKTNNRVCTKELWSANTFAEMGLPHTNIIFWLNFIAWWLGALADRSENV
jgi:hypothetical protein